MAEEEKKAKNIENVAIFYDLGLVLNCYIDHVSFEYYIGEDSVFSMVVPDGMTALVFSFGQLSTRLNHDKSKTTTIKTSHIVGPKSKFCYIKPVFNSEVICIRFKPGSFKNFTSIPQNYLCDKVIDAYEVFGYEIYEIEDKLFRSKDNKNEALNIIVKFLLSKLNISANLFFDNILRIMNDKIFADNFTIKMSNYPISYKTLERLFLANMGINPKSYLKILQFNYASYLMENAENLTQVAYESGYYDQSHFIRSFKSLACKTPKDYLKIESKIFKINQNLINSHIIELKSGAGHLT